MGMQRSGAGWGDYGVRRGCDGYLDGGGSRILGLDGGVMVIG